MYGGDPVPYLVIVSGNPLPSTSIDFVDPYQLQLYTEKCDA